MPHYNIWIREGDNKKWLELPNRSEFLHDCLNTSEMVIGDILKTKAKPGTIDPMSGLEIKEFHTNSNPEVDRLYEGLLTPKIASKDKETCCDKARLCKHWIFNEPDSILVNELTGETRDMEL